MADERSGRHRADRAGTGPGAVPPDRPLPPDLPVAPPVMPPLALPPQLDDGHVVPLRPYGLGAMYVGMARVLRTAPAAVVGAALLGFALTAAVQLAAGPTETRTRRAADAYGNLRVSVHVHSGAAVVAALAAFVVLGVGAALVPVTLSLVAGQQPGGLDGRAGLRAAGGYGLVVVLGIPGTVLIALGSDRPGVVLLGGVLSIVMGWVAVRLTVLPAVMAAEGLSYRAGLRRSWSLVHGSWWRTLGLTLMFDVTTYLGAVAVGVSNLVTSVGQRPGTVVDVPSRDTVVAVALLALLSLPMGVIGRTLLYVDLRCRREGLAWQLDAARRGTTRPTFGPDGTYARPLWARSARR